MNRKKYRRNQSELMSLLGKEQARSRTQHQQATTTAIQKIAAIDAGEPCDDGDAIHDLAAMRDGNMDRAGVERLSQHLGACRRCRVLLAMMAADLSKAEGTGTHVVAPEPNRDPSEQADDLIQ